MANLFKNPTINNKVTYCFNVKFYSLTAWELVGN